MAKTHKLSTDWTHANGKLSLSVEARDTDADKDALPIGTFKRSINMLDVFGKGYADLNDAGQAAIGFGAFTALRNSTGSCDTLDEAETAVERRLDAWANGEWGSERESSATPFTANAIIAMAVERASNGAMSAADAAIKLCEHAEATCSANDVGAFAQLDAADRAKIRKAVVDAIRSTKPAIAAAYLLIESERAEAANARKRNAAMKAAEAAAASGEGTTL